MAVPTATVWQIEPHTQAKHEILTRYLDAWFPILTSWNEKVFFIDGFAGPGRYHGGEPGSPLLAIEAAQRRAAMLAGSTVMFLFNESDKARFDMLEAQLVEVNNELSSNFQIYTDNKDFVDLAQEMVDSRGDRSLVPTFAFIDPFGWKGVPIDLITNLVRDRRSELFILFSFNSVNRWIGHKGQQDNMIRLFGCDDFRRAEGMKPSERKTYLAALYERQLMNLGKFAHISRFEMIEKSGRTSYFLYHCTRSLKGLEVMRSAMWKIDPNRGCQFSDRIAGLENLYEGPLNLDLDERLMNRFAGQRVPIKTLQEFVLTDTQFAPEHLKRPTLKPMQEDGRIVEVVGQNRRGTFPAGVEVVFAG
jgi:three-Cys-motif partner protein